MVVGCAGCGGKSNLVKVFVMADDSNKCMVLVVDDDPSIRMLVSNTLRSAGFVSQVANDGQDALDKVEKNRPDAILMDINMPGMNGIEACTRLKGQASTADIPIVFMTSLGNDTDRVRGFDVGGDDYIIKPVNYKELLARMRRFVNDGVSGVDGHAMLGSVKSCQSLLKELSEIEMPKDALKIVQKLEDNIKKMQSFLDTKA